MMELTIDGKKQVYPIVKNWMDRSWSWKAEKLKKQRIEIQLKDDHN
jgi:hypothetical protein